MKTVKNKTVLLSVLLIGAFLSACSTINNLSEYNLRDKNIALEMRTPPDPVVDVSYSMHFDKNNQFESIIRIGTNLIKAGEAEAARGKLLRALYYTDIPGIMSERILSEVAYTLDAWVTDSRRDADVILELDIVEYGINAGSSSGSVELFIRIEACLYHRAYNEIIWRRRISVQESVSPGFFGFNDIAGNAITISNLMALTEEQLTAGFERMAREISRETARKLQRDLRKAR